MAAQPIRTRSPSKQTSKACNERKQGVVLAVNCNPAHVTLKIVQDAATLFIFETHSLVFIQDCALYGVRYGTLCAVRAVIL